MSQLSFFRTDLKLGSHTKWIQRYLENGHQYPVTLEIDPANECPLACMYCSSRGVRSGKRAGVSLETDLLLKVVREAAGLGVKSIIWTGGGEPLSNPAVVPAIRLASELGMKNGMFTTGIPMTPVVAESIIGYLTWIRFHLDAASPRAYAGAHRVSEELFYRATANIRAFVELRAARGISVKSGIGSVAFTYNFTEVGPLARFAKESGLDYFQYKHDLNQMKDRRYLDWWDDDAVPVLEEISRDLEDDTFSIQFSRGEDYSERDPSRRCHAHYLNTAVTAEGNVTYCKSLRNRADMVIGNVYHKTLQDIFDGDLHRRLAETVIPSTCGVKPCPYHRANLLLDKLASPAGGTVPGIIPNQAEHRDFI